jgi:hypothetical protein
MPSSIPQYESSSGTIRTRLPSALGLMKISG